jgi:MtN3 and saliva related transmembrane protein
MKGLLVDSIGMPQAIHVVRSRDTAALSLTGTIAFTIGIALWLVYGLALMDWPLITSDAVTLALMAVIVAMKVRYG